ncbi:MAG: TatD family hydrolase [Lachnospiraceae bacterium]|jgi:TatD DNase family protein|nr:TatD family hydrolase [Lachnospiraceae bacterium]
MTGIFDTHAHYDDEAFSSDRDELLDSMVRSGVVRIVNAAASLGSTESTADLAGRYPFIYGTAGVHPDEVGELNEESFAWLKEAARREKIVAVGEIGLDYYWDKEQHDRQKYWFVRQLGLARELGLPVVVHSREAARDTLDIIKSEAADLCCDIHCFSYGVEMAREYLDRGHYLGVGGVVTFKNARKLKEVVEYMPPDRLLLETDSPYLTPAPHRGARNSSLYLPYVVQAVAAIRGISEEEVIRITYDNAMRFYGLREEAGKGIL